MSIGNEPSAPYAATDPDPIRNVNVTGPARVSSVQVYIQDDAPDTVDWEVTDLVIRASLAAPRGVQQCPSATTERRSPRLRNVHVDATLHMGDSPTVRSSAFSGLAYGLYLQRVDGADIELNLNIRGDATAISGWRAAVADDCVRPVIDLHVPNLPSGGGVLLRRCTRAELRGEIVASADVNAPLVTLESCPDTLIDANLLGQKSGLGIVAVTAGTATSVIARRGKWSHAAGAVAGLGFGHSSVSMVAAADLIDVDMSEAFQPLPLSFTDIPYDNVAFCRGVTALFPPGLR